MNGLCTVLCTKKTQAVNKSSVNFNIGLKGGLGCYSCNTVHREQFTMVSNGLIFKHKLLYTLTRSTLKLNITIIR